MTSDAKIGLLLGLVFIFIIAFIINGLPIFRANDSDNSNLTEKLVTPGGSAGIGERERNATNAIIDPQEHSSTIFAQKAVEDKPVVANDANQTRFTMVLPGSDNERPIKTVELFKVPEQVIQPAAPAAAPAVPTATSVGSSEPVKPLDMPGTNKPALERFYVIEKGDTLAGIAKKFYGTDQSNLRGNIEKIYQANRNTLTSKNDITVGQKLVIPSLTEDRKVAKSSSVLESKIFEKVESIGMKRLFSGNTKPAPALRQVQAPVKERFYTVRGGESLWGVAEKQLGDGSRYREIIKLNKDVLKDGDTVEVGMKLKLPAK